MSSPSVWVRLYYEGDKPKGRPVEIEPVPKNIGALAEAAKAKLKPKLDHAPVDEIFVFSPGTTFHFSQDNALDPGEIVPHGTTSKKPLIVQAPAPQQQAQQSATSEQALKAFVEKFSNMQLDAQSANAASLSLWSLTPDEQVNAWRTWFETAAEQKNLPDKPFLIESDKRPRYELTDRFVVRECFGSFEDELSKASNDAKENKTVAAISVLGVKGGGKSVFFRYYCSKHCSQRLVLYVPNAGTNAGQMYGKMMRGLIFGLQCLNTQVAQDLLQKVRALPVNGDIDMFYTLWDQWKQAHYDLCRDAIIVIDQLEREGDLFQKLRDGICACGAYILVSSTGILHHHNVSSVYTQLTYSYPVLPGELSSIDTGNKLKDIQDDFVTMLYAVILLESKSGLNQTESNIEAAQKHFKWSKNEGVLQKLLALVQSEELGERIDGTDWKKVTDPNYLWIETNRKVFSPFKEYMGELRSLFKQEQVEYKAALIALLSNPDIVNKVGNAALGVHIEALLDLSWRENQAIGWEQEKVLGNGSQTRQSQGRKGKKFKNFKTIDFYGNLPEETDLKEVNWKMPVYFKPKRTNYPGFDMFVLAKDGNRYNMYAMQVTVKNAKEHGVETFDENHKSEWDKLVKKGANCTCVDWRFYMLTPERHPGPERPKSAFRDIPIFQVDFRDLLPGDQYPCGIKTVQEFPDRLESK